MKYSAENFQIFSLNFSKQKNGIYDKNWCMQERGKHCFDIEATFETWRQSRRRPTRRQELAASQTVFRYWTASSGHHVSAAEVSSSSWREHLLTSELKLLQENWPSTWDWIDLSAFPFGAQWTKNTRIS